MEQKEQQKEENGRLKEKLSNHKEEIKSLQEEIKTLQEENKRLQEGNKTLQEENRTLQEGNKALQEENKELNRQLNLNSTNSSKPPSSDSPQVIRLKKKPTGRKKGKQPGSKGHKRKTLEPTEIIDHYAERCKRCGADLDRVPSKSYRSRQQVEIPPIIPIVTEHRYHRTDCPICKMATTAEAKEEEKVCTGARLTALLVILATAYNLSRRNVQAIVGAILGIDMSLGSIENRIQEVGKALEGPVEELKNQLPKEKKLHIDETGWKEKGKKRWVWIFVAAKFVFFYLSPSRGGKVLREILGESYSGVIISDYYNVYRSYAQKWQTCLAHIIRKAKELGENEEKEVSGFGHLIRRELKLMIKLWKKGKSKSQEMDECKIHLKGLCTYFKDSPNKQVRNLSKLILDGWEAVIYFTEVEGIDPTNNIAERLLRMLVIARKLSFGSQSEEGMRTTGRLRTVTGTCKMRGTNAWDYLTDVYQKAMGLKKFLDKR